MLRNRIPAVIVLVLVLVTLTFRAAAAAGERMSITTDARTVEVGVDFNGCRVAVAGEAPEGSQVYVKVVGPARTVGLSRQGKKGPVWLAVESVRVDGMPAVYQVVGSNGFDLPEEVRRATGIGPDYRELYAGARVQLTDGERRTVLDAERARPYLDGLVRINEERDLYRLIQEGIQVYGTSYAGNIFLPPGLPQGELQLTAYAVRNGRVIAQAERTVAVRSVGLVRLIGDAAQHQAAAYGLASIAVAVASGLAVVQIFRRLTGLAGKQDGVTTGH